MVSRNRTFVKSHMRVQKARKQINLKEAYARVVSIGTDRFDGWRSQETGQAPKKKRVAMDAARVGSSLNRNMKRNARLWKGKKFPVAEDQGTVRKIDDKRIRVAAGLSKLAKSGYRGLVKIETRQSGKHNSGFYLLKARKAVLAQTEARKQPKRNKWMTRAQKRMTNREVAQLWRRVAKDIHGWNKARLAKL